MDKSLLLLSTPGREGREDGAEQKSVEAAEGKSLAMENKGTHE